MCACGKAIPPKTTAGRPRKTCGQDCSLLAPKKVKYKRLGERTYECAVCHSSFEADRGRQHCSPYCKERARHLKKRPDAPARGPLAHLTERPCANCGKAFKPRVGRHGTYCTRECAFERLAIIRRLAASPSSGRQCLVYFKACANCGAIWTARHKATPVCSNECGKAIAAAKERARNIAKCGGKGARPCQWCGVEFIPVYGDKRSVFCSDKCCLKQSKQAGKTPRKRARKYGVPYESVSRIKVFNRDGWKCQICGRRTPRNRMGTLRPDAPELDHRIPISKGGAHSYANVQCACRECNIAKGNRSSAGQLPLFAP
jgi:5-methylcytosine-specific restriction endonuclease McrA